VNEIAFPVLGPLFVFGIVLPLSALLTKALLVAVGSFPSSSGLSSQYGLRYALLVGSSAVPLAWFVSAGLHQAEGGADHGVCAVAHDQGVLCVEAAYFALGLSALTIAFALPRIVREQFMIRASASEGALLVRARIESLLRSSSALLALRGAVLVSDGARAPIATLGLFAPRVVVQTAFAEALDDEALVAALHHELEHFSERDPLIYFIAWWGLAVNPVGRWLLGSEHSRWLLGREADCDRQAVLSGASAPALAHALLLAARPTRSRFVATLGAGHVDAVKLRLGLLLAYADQPPRGCSHRSAMRMVLVVVAVVLLLPHGGGTGGVDLVHEATEGVASLLLRN